MLTVIAYDIADDQRRVRIGTLLEDYGTRVNYSVFECELEREEFARLQEQLAELIDDAEDRLVFYRLCESCRVRRATMGAIEKHGKDNRIIIV
jgi:CRISPR-associated protein Cas2